jgi:hypothetical protein
MTKQVSGYLSENGSFFETEAECARYESWIAITKSCESHGINPQNFFELLHEWSRDIKGYYHADDNCIEKRSTPKGRVEFAREDESEPESLPRAEDNNPYATVRVETDAGLLELPIRKHERVSNVRSGTRSEAVPTARKGTGS